MGDNCDKCNNLNSAWFPTHDCNDCRCSNCDEDVLNCHIEILNKINSNIGTTVKCKTNKMCFIKEE